jgi:GTP-binding protein
MTKNTPFSHAQFIISAYHDEQFPNLQLLSGAPMPEIAIVGRSNVGKSSLINHLLNKRKLAKTSGTPGKTQALNFFTVDENLAIVDLPGYGFAQVSYEIKQQWSKLIDLYFQKRTTLKLILLLLDSRHMPTEEDCAFVRWASFSQIPLLLLFTKSDKINQRDRRRNALASLEILKMPLSFIHYSIKESRARLELINTLLEQQLTWD